MHAAVALWEDGQELQKQGMDLRVEAIDFQVGAAAGRPAGLRRQGDRRLPVRRAGLACADRPAPGAVVAGLPVVRAAGRADSRDAGREPGAQMAPGASVGKLAPARRGTTPWT